ILRQLADGQAVTSGKIVDGLQVALADAMGNGADMGVGGDAAVKGRLAVLCVAHLADQLDVDGNRVMCVLRPCHGRRLDAVDKAYCADRAEIDRDQPADGPQAPGLLAFLARVGGESRTRAVALDHTAEDAQVRLSSVASFLTGRLAGFRAF